MTAENTWREISDIRARYSKEIFPLRKELEERKCLIYQVHRLMDIPSQSMEIAQIRQQELLAKIESFEAQRRAELEAIHKENGLMASTLKELSRIRGGAFIEENSKTKKYRPTTVRWAHSAKLEEFAYFCKECKLWIIGRPRQGRLPGDDNIFNPSDYYFCILCDTQVGMVEMHIRRALERSYKP